MYAYPFLIKELKDNGMSAKDLADLLCVSPRVIYSRLSGASEWRLSEIVKICEHFEKTNVNELFLR